MKKIILKSICCVISLFVFVLPAEAKQKKVFLFAGQSNMSGADALIAGTGAQDLVDAGLQTIADQNTQFAYKLGFNNDNTPTYGWGDIRGHLGVSYSQPGYYVMGPEVGFGRTLYDNGVDDVAIISVSANIPCPPAGLEWPWINENSASQSPDFYTQWTDFIDARLSELTSNGDTYSIEGFVWWQGIDDAFNNTPQDQYEANLTTLISMLRDDYGTSDMPFVLVRSDSDISSQIGLESIRAAQMSVIEADPNAAWVSCDDLTSANTHHFTAASQLTVGQRVGEAFLDMDHAPEPATMSLVGLSAFVLIRRRRK